MHAISAVILKGEYNKEEAEKYDLLGVELGFNLTMFFIDIFFTACWQKKLGTLGVLETNCPKTTFLYPREMVIYELMKRISESEQVEYAIILTDYFGGAGEQFANVYQGDKNVDLEINRISKALKYLGVKNKSPHDEFDTVGLGKYRSNPNYLDKYGDLADELGV